MADLARRIESLEAAVRDLAGRAPRTPPPDIIQLEVMVSRTLRAELPALLDSLASRPAPAPPPAPGRPSAAADDPAAGDLHRRIEELEALHHRTLDALAADRRQLVDDAVAQIRTLLFGS